MRNDMYRLDWFFVWIVESPYTTAKDATKTKIVEMIVIHLRIISFLELKPKFIHKNTDILP